jgi:hypothetical protein
MNNKPYGFGANLLYFIGTHKRGIVPHSATNGDDCAIAPLMTLRKERISTNAPHVGIGR